MLGLERTEEAKAQLQEMAAAFVLAFNEQKENMTDWQLLAAGGHGRIYGIGEEAI